MSSRSAPVAFRAHDHGECRHAVLSEVAEDCRSGNLRLTPARSCVLEALLEEHKALSAYELLDRLRAAGLGSQPPAVYRALDVLVGHGLVHKIEGLSAFVACTQGRGAHASAFFFCRECRRVSETPVPEMEAFAENIAVAQSFATERIVMEVEGLCGLCRAGTQ